MKSRTTKIVVDICMTVFLVLSFIRWEDSNFIFHAFVGIACTVFFTLHVCIHWKWLKAITKSCINGKLNKALRWKYVVDIILLVIWGAAIVSGFLAVGYFSFGVEGMATFSRIHGVTSRVGLVPLAIHIIQHIPQITSYFGFKKGYKKTA